MVGTIRSGTTPFSHRWQLTGSDKRTQSLGKMSTDGGAIYWAKIFRVLNQNGHFHNETPM